MVNHAFCVSPYAVGSSLEEFGYESVNQQMVAKFILPPLKKIKY